MLHVEIRAEKPAKLGLDLPSLEEAAAGAPSETAVPSPCLLEQISQRLMIRQFTMISGT